MPVVLLGLLVGRASDELVHAEGLRLRLAVAEARRRDAAEIHDGVLQRLTVAKWREEAGSTADAVAAIEETMEIGEALVVSLLADADEQEQRRARPPG